MKKINQLLRITRFFFSFGITSLLMSAEDKNDPHVQKLIETKINQQDKLLAAIDRKRETLSKCSFRLNGTPFPNLFLKDISALSALAEDLEELETPKEWEDIPFFEEDMSQIKRKFNTLVKSD